MPKETRHAIYEGAIILAVALALVFIIPTLISAHDSIALLAAGLLGIGLIAWVIFFLIRISRSLK